MGGEEGTSNLNALALDVRFINDVPHGCEDCKGDVASKLQFWNNRCPLYALNVLSGTASQIVAGTYVTYLFMTVF